MGYKFEMVFRMMMEGNELLCFSLKKRGAWIFR